MSELINEFQQFRTILCITPCCKKLKRISDLKLKTNHKLTTTWLDEYEQESNKLDNKISLFEEKEVQMREIAVEKGRKDAEKIVIQNLNPEFRKLKLNPFDIKPILNPVDFVVFNGMDKEEVVKNILFISTESKHLKDARKQVEKAIDNKKYDWKEGRISDKGQITIK